MQQYVVFLTFILSQTLQAETLPQISSGLNNYSEAKQQLPLFLQDPLLGSWGSYFHFGRNMRGTRTDLSGNIISKWQTSADPDNHAHRQFRFCKKNADGTWDNLCENSIAELRTIKKNCKGGNSFYWLRGYSSNGNRFRLSVLKAIIEFDNGTVYDITDNDCNKDSDGLPDGIPYALYNVVTGYKIKVWFDQRNHLNQPTAVNYWEQYYHHESAVKSKCWRGDGSDTVPAIVQQQTSYQVVFKAPLTSATNTKNHFQVKNAGWKLDAANSVGDLAAVTIDYKTFGTIKVILPNGLNTNYTWESSSGRGRGLGWTSVTEFGENCLADIEPY